MKTRPDKRKITVQLWRPLLNKLNEYAAAACLNRDAYLDVVFANEAQMLTTELDGRRNSDRARAWIKQCFSELKDHQPVSFTLTAETAQALTDACNQANVWRDAFVNRVIFLLVAKSSTIETQLGFRFADHVDAISDAGWEIKSLLLGPRLVAIRSFVNDDPFLGIRAALSGEYGEEQGALHDHVLGEPSGTTPQKRGIAGFNAYLEDRHVPGTPENQEWQKASDELLDLLADDVAVSTGAIQ
jgi:hypothetical protein